MRTQTLRVLFRLLRLFAAKEDREPLVGDLLEEYTERSAATGAGKALAWLFRQVCMSAPAMIRAGLAQRPWPSSLGIAVLAWLAVGVVEALINKATSVWVNATDSYNPAAMFFTMPFVVVIAFLAARVRRDAVLLLAVLMLLAVTLMTLTKSEVMPLWFRIAYLVVGPTASWMGARLQARFWPR